MKRLFLSAVAAAALVALGGARSARADGADGGTVLGSGPWEHQPPPDSGLVQSICGDGGSNAQWVGKTTIYLSGGWIGGSGVGWFDSTRGGGPTTGVGAYRDWETSLVRALPDGGCTLDTSAERNQLRVEGGWSTGFWSSYKRLELGAAYVFKASPDVSVAFGGQLYVHGVATTDWATGVAPELRLTYGDWLGVRAAANLGFLGHGEFDTHRPQGTFEVFISKQLKEEHFP
jgi:hypothetical protein